MDVLIARFVDVNFDCQHETQLQVQTKFMQKSIHVLNLAADLDVLTVVL